MNRLILASLGALILLSAGCRNSYETQAEVQSCLADRLNDQRDTARASRNELECRQLVELRHHQQ